MKLGSGLSRVARAMELGVNVALGTDGCASNDNLDMFEEMHVASLIHKGFSLDPTVLSAWDIIEMATVNGARALRLEDSGEISIGKAADLAVINLDAFHLVPTIDIPNILVNSCGAEDVAMTLINGKVVYEKTSSGPLFNGGKGFLQERERIYNAVGRLFS
jgi:5-methylthioadenosine/S-adenosylhomocysteine deaminase